MHELNLKNSQKIPFFLKKEAKIFIFHSKVLKQKNVFLMHTI